MSTPIPGAGDNLDSAAKLNLMLEALSKASVELEKTVNVLTEQLAGYNQSLDKTLRDELQASRERLEAALRQNQEGLLKDKEAVVKALAEFKQAEIKKVILSGKTVRTGLAAQVEDATRALTATMSGKITGIKEQLNTPEAEMKHKYDELHQSLQSAVAESQSKLFGAKAAEENLLSMVTKDYDGKVVQALTAGQQNYDRSFTQKKIELESHSEKVVSELAQKYDLVIGRLEGSHQAGLAGVGENNQQALAKLKQLSDSGNQIFAEQGNTFQQSLLGLGVVLNGLYEARLNNLAAQSRTEISSAAHHAEECLTTTKAELQVCLKDFQRDYVEQFEALHSRLEKSLEEFAARKDSGAVRGLKEERVREQLHSLFRRLGQEMLDSAASASNRLEDEFQKSMDACSQRIDTAKAQACDSLSRESGLMQKELARSFEEFDKQLIELQAQAARLEKSGRDVANFVLTIKQANLDF